MTSAIGERVKGLIHSAQPQLTQAAVAAQIEMTPDAFSRALNGARGFAASELARLSEYFGVSMYWLATGREDPGRALLAARHEYDHEAGLHKSADLEKSSEAREAIELVYQQGFPDAKPISPLPVRTPEDVRTALGEGFVFDFADRVEQKLGIDVVRFEGLRTALSLVIAGRRCIALQPSPNWFYQNWSLAHELGHLVFGDQTSLERVTTNGERSANQFAADLLLPEATMRSIDWTRVQAHELAELLWQWGVSTKSVGFRLSTLRLESSALVSELLTQTTQAVIRRHYSPGSRSVFSDEMGDRMQAASTRRFPGELLEAHSRGVEAGRLHVGSLAWMLGVAEDEIEPLREEVTVAIESDELARLLGHSL